MSRRRPLSAAGHVVACLGGIAGPPRPYRMACYAPLRTCALACHDTIHCIVTQGRKMGSSPSSFPALFFFFHLFHLLEDHKKKKNFHFPIKQNKFIKKKFSSFTHCKTSEKFLPHIFFPMFYSPSTQITQHTQQFIHNT